MVVSALRKVARLGRRMVGVDEHKRVFNWYYSSKIWGGGSGSGSTPEVTAPYRDFLTDFMKQHAIKSVVDLGCGDWQFSHLIDWTGIDYTGVDVSSVVLRNNSKFAKPGVRFIEMNGVTGDIPNADLLIMKDVAQHLTNDDIRRFIPNLSKFKYALITNGSYKVSDIVNSENTIGGCRPVDLTAEPFNLPGEYVFEFEADEPKITFLWTRP
jgi:SAM-dependent methyltransferase